MSKRFEVVKKVKKQIGKGYVLCWETESMKEVQDVVGVKYKVNVRRNWRGMEEPRDNFWRGERSWGVLEPLMAMLRDRSGAGAPSSWVGRRWTEYLIDPWSWHKLNSQLVPMRGRSPPGFPLQRTTWEDVHRTEPRPGRTRGNFLKGAVMFFLILIIIVIVLLIFIVISSIVVGSSHSFDFFPFFSCS